METNKAIKYNNDIVKPMLSEFKSEIITKIKDGVSNLFNFDLPELSVRLHQNGLLGLPSFEIFIKDENGDSVFATSIEVETNTRGLWSEVIKQGKDLKLDHSIKSVRVTSNQRDLDNKYEKAQILIAAFIMSKELEVSGDFHTYIETISQELLSVFSELDKLSKESK